jgi:anti-anti-sigma factor
MKKAVTGPKTYGLKVDGQKGQAVHFALSGRLALENFSEVQAELRAQLQQLVPANLSVDLSQIEYLDSSGALALRSLEGEARRQTIPLAFVNATPEAQRVMDLVDPEAIAAPPLRGEEDLNFFEQVGQGAIGVVEEGHQLLSFFGELLIALAGSILRPFQVRWREVLVICNGPGWRPCPSWA